MKMDKKYIRRRRTVAFVVGALLISLFTYATRDVCYVGEGGNALGYGSCLKMIDEVIAQSKEIK
jgi:hypothetical protein